MIKEVFDAGLQKSSKIYELKDLSDLAQNGQIQRKGANKECTIEKRKGATYVHSIKDLKAIRLETIILSYAWGYTIGDIIDTLQVHCKDNVKVPKDVYVWICCLCVSQHRVIELKKQGKNILFDDFRLVFNKHVN